ncbi:bifunctional hydroxymethylpyrimidine kinase/phosphomethylpyrimidine kinase [Streptococcus thoraltensis]|uniref:bifunctional hydroxymethylpyrimidine kinase/phosphomethylpyrimidine kinase n=1 Tax=Streptococcus thoraltensis TaxID=55085 RepID=UPI0003619B65|nr:bifunctional hydroxymethylpyrimidine kinase/phosphomethylpyrimidine kinase [Streptococcus thoraltensis]MDY4760861.1 bifunctional hydroxymethylpyrimidine kinase/phosphomethylpyrimidine kinase [Streptococcus thoraltensis]
MKTPYILTIAGNDILSGGGFQADLATFSVHKLYGFLAQTCMTALTEEGFEIIPTADDLFQKQLNSLKDIPFAAIKIGLLPTPQIARAVRCFIKERPQVPLVLDPVLVFKENADQEVAQMSQELQKLFSYATIMTPNLKEAELLSGQKISNLEEMEKAARLLRQMGAKSVVIKGGERLDKDQAYDVLLVEDGQVDFLRSPLLSRNNQGAGCTFASAIASGLAKKQSVSQAVHKAKDFVYQAIAHSNDYGVTQYEKN